MAQSCGKAGLTLASVNVIGRLSVAEQDPCRRLNWAEEKDPWKSTCIR